MAGGAEPAAVPWSRYFLYGSLAIGGLAADLATKSWIFRRLGMPGGDAIWLWSPYLSLETHLNEGALFGIGQGRQPVFIVMSLIAAGSVLAWLFWWGAARDRWLTAALGCVSGGMAGNLYDRLGMPALAWNYPAGRVGQPVYAVRDWVHFQIPGLLDWPVFNVADSLLVCGAALLIVHALFLDRPQPPAEEAGGQGPS